MQVARGAAASSAFAGTVEAQLARLIFLNPEAAPNAAFAPRVAVALSGGADSLALTLITDAWARSHGGSLVALTVDHRLRAESTREAAQVAEWMRARGIAHHILTPEHTAAAANLQEAARQWRYDAVAEYCHAQGILHCLIAHHAGDNRETVLLHQARGDTADGDSGMAACRNYRGVRFLRPMLGVERAAIEAFLQHHGVAWVEDPSNTNPRFARVRARAQLATDSASHACRDAAHHAAAQARRARDITLAHAAMQLVTLHPLGFAQLSLEGWRQLPAPLASQLLADCLTTISGRTHRPRAHETARLVAALQAHHATAPPLRRTLQHCEISTQGDTLTIAREVARVATPLTLQGRGCILWDRRFRVRYDLPAGQSLTLRALGHAGRKQLPAAATLPLATPSLWHLDALAFVPHIGMHASALLAVEVGFAPAKPLAGAPFW